MKVLPIGKPSYNRGEQELQLYENVPENSIDYQWRFRINKADKEGGSDFATERVYADVFSPSVCR